jgi:nucleotide-binding universal stress UspA family protein
MTIRKILVPIDFSSHSTSALLYAVELSKQLDAAVDAFHIWRPSHPVWPKLLIDSPSVSVDEIVTLGRIEIPDELPRFLASTLGPNATVVKPRYGLGAPSDGITKLASEEHFDLIVMGTHGTTGVTHMVLGSVAEAVVRSAPCPVLTLR